jgi:hypothetical protein
MAGYYTNGLVTLNTPTGSEQVPLDTQLTGGANPQEAQFNLFQLAQAVSLLGNGLDKTMVAGSRYYTAYSITTPQTFTGARVRVGGTGGTDNWILELHGPTGLLLATTATAGTTAGTANTWQQIAFTTTYTVTVPGTYWVAIQSNGTTAKFDSINAIATLTGVPFTGSATGTFGTGASITPPTTYTANLGPKIWLY